MNANDIPAWGEKMMRRLEKVTKGKQSHTDYELFELDSDYKAYGAEPDVLTESELEELLQ